MATGNSRTKWNGNIDSLSKEKGSRIELSYTGKSSEAQILASAQPLELISLWGNSEAQNRLYYGDNLAVLGNLLYDSAVKGKVKLIYLDPPFATRSVFHSRQQVDAYTDLLDTADYIEFIRQRLVLLRELLASDGSIYVHLDENMAFHIKIVMDEVFGQRNFRNWITRKKCNPKNYTRKTYGNVSDYILFYTKSDNYVWNRPMSVWSDKQAKKEYSYYEPDTNRFYKKVPIHAPGVRNGETGKIWRGMLPPPGKHWQFTPETLDAMDARGEIYWSPTGNPRRKIYLDQSEGIPIQDIWLDFKDAHNQNIWITGYPTEKNSALLTRIIEASSNPNDLVLDCFSGSGTTLEVAAQLRRNWIGVDNSPEAIATTLRRFSNGLKPMGDFVNRLEFNESQDRQLAFEALTFSDERVCDDFDNSNIVNDFSIFAAPSYTDELADSLANWTKASSSSNVNKS